MVDLQSQYLRLKPEIDQAISEVIDSATFIKGPQVTAFEKELAEYLKIKHVITCANGTDALMLALMALDLKAGDEVVTPSFTFIATAETIAFLGLKPVFADVNPKTFNIDPDHVKRLITSKTKAIMPVHLFGQAADMISLLRISEKYNIPIIEDNAQAIGSTYSFPCGTPHKTGTFGKIGCTSFFPSKNLGCFGDGGALFTNDDALAEKTRLLSNHGMKTRYYHDAIGVNSRLDTLQAAVLLVKLKHLDDFNTRRQQAADFYDKAFTKIKGIEIPARTKESKHIFHQYTLKITNGKRDALKQYLEDAGIPVMIYYPIPLHQQKAFSGVSPVSLKQSELLSQQVLSLPMHSELNEEQLQYISQKIVSFFS